MPNTISVRSRISPSTLRIYRVTLRVSRVNDSSDGPSLIELSELRVAQLLLSSVSTYNSIPSLELTQRVSIRTRIPETIMILTRNA